jgi:hypothetical protein
MGKTEQIIGKTAFARLKKANKSSDAAIKKMDPAQLMGLAGIGPVKAGKLLRSLGKKVSQKQVESVYGRLKNRTRFKRVKAFVKSLGEDPRERINKIEARRSELIAWQNLLATTRNIGRPQSERIRPLTYAPVSTTLDPFAVEIGETTGDQIYGEVFIRAEEGRAHIHYESRDLTDGQVMVSENEYVDNQNTVSMITDIGDAIEDMYNRFRKKTLVGLFFVVLDRQYERIGFYDSLRERFRKLIDSEKLILKASFEEYYDWEALFKYQGNKAFEALVSRLDRYHRYVLYNEYVKNGGEESFGVWSADENNWGRDMFWSYMENVTRSNQKSSQEIKIAGGTVHVGVLKGVPGLEQFETEWKIQNANIPFFRDTGYEEFKKLKREMPVKIGSSSVPAIVGALVNATLDTFTIHTSMKDGRVAFRSDELPEMGVVWDGK